MSNSHPKSSGQIAATQSCASETTKKNSSRHLTWLLQSFIFFTLFYLYLWLYIDPKLIYHGAGIITNFPAFYKTWSFFPPFLSYPGGPMDYLSAFLSQLFYYSWVGALVVTVQAWMMYLCLDYLLKAANLLKSNLICFALPILLLVLYSRYTYYFVTTMTFLAALLCVCLYLKLTLSRKKVLSCVTVFLIISVILYYLAGGAFLLFAVLCVIYELFFRSRWKISLLYLLSAAFIPYLVGLLVLGVSIVDAFSNSLPFSWKTLHYEARRRAVEIVYALYLLPPLIFLALGLWHRLVERLHIAKKRTSKKPVKRHQNKIFILPIKMFFWYRCSRKVRFSTELLLLLAIAGSVVFFTRNDSLRTRFKVDYFAFHKMWPELLISARQYPTDPFIAHAVNRALYHRGRLGYDMFSWPQQPDYLFLSDEKYKWMYWQIFDVFLDLGVINLAENDLTECLEGIGERPMILQRLALINMIKGNSDSAKIYLGALSETLFDADWAKHYLDLLETDPNLSTDKNIQHQRSLCLDKDCLTYALLKERTLSWLLEKNNQNRMAFEYLMAWYMINKQMGKFVQNLERLQDFNYREVPTHYEEAALIYVYGTGKPIQLDGYLSNPQKRQEIEDFSRILNSYGKDKKAAFNELSKKFNDTYFFYYMYAPSDTSK
jgi:hypothetical protein